MQLGKIVSIACLTYIIYGITSVFQVGTFLPPIPLKPFIYIFFAVIGVVFGIRSKTSFISYALIGWLALFALNSNAFLETILSTGQMIHYEQNIAVFVALLIIVIFLLHSVFLLLAAIREDKRYGLLFVPLISAIVFHFVEDVALSFNVIIIGWGTVLFIVERSLVEKLPGLFSLSPILYGAAVIELVEIIALAG
jgi:uncharacterized membrane protein YuzA (DUF378 family)